MHRPASTSAAISRGPRIALASVLSGVIVLHAASASAAPPATRNEISDAEVTRRLEFIELRLRRGTAATQRWWYSWFFGFAALSTGQAIVAIATTNPGLRADSAVGAASSGLGVLALGVIPFPALHAARAVYEIPEATPEQRRRKLARAEQILKRSADAESSYRSWYTHVIAGGVSIGIGLGLWLGYDRLASGARNALIGIALNEVRIFSHPAAAIQDWEEYRRQWTPVSEPAPRKATVQWSLTPYAGGLGVSGNF